MLSLFKDTVVYVIFYEKYFGMWDGQSMRVRGLVKSMRVYQEKKAEMLREAYKMKEEVRNLHACIQTCLQSFNGKPHNGL